MTDVNKFAPKPISEQLQDELHFDDEEAARITLSEDKESLSIYVDGLFAGYADKEGAKTHWALDTLVYGAIHHLQGHAEAIKATFQDFESLGTNQRIRASILKDSTPADLHCQVLDWLEEGFSRDEKFYPLVVADNENPRDLLLDLLREWGSRWYSKR